MQRSLSSTVQQQQLNAVVATKIQQQQKSSQQQQQQHQQGFCYSEYSNTIMLLFMFRGPLVWLFGMSFFTSSSIVLWDFLLSSFHTSMIPLLFAILFLIVSLWTIGCVAVFIKDVYNLLVYPIVVRPAIARASQCSIDDVLTILCDPTQLASYISAMFVIPMTLYSLPTTPQQRAQILLSSTTFHTKNDTDNKQIFTEPGGWKYLLPKSMQQLVDSSNGITTGSTLNVRTCNSESTDNHGNTSTVDAEDDSNIDDEHIGIENTTNKTGTGNTFSARRTTVREPRNHRESLHRTEAKSSSTPIHQKKEYSQTNDDVLELFTKIFIDIVNDKFHSACKRLEKHQSSIILTATATFTLLILQFRNSHTARSIFKSVVHILLTTTSSLTLVGSLLALLTPYIHQQLLQHQQQQHNANRTPSASTKNDVRRRSTTFLSSILKSNYDLVMFKKIPKTIPMIKSTIQQFLVRWKGTVAVFILTYYQYKKLRQGQQHTRRREE